VGKTRLAIEVACGGVRSSGGVWMVACLRPAQLS
jgi:hypothetical protein